LLTPRRRDPDRRGHHHEAERHPISAEQASTEVAEDVSQRMPPSRRRDGPRRDHDRGRGAPAPAIQPEHIPTDADDELEGHPPSGTVRVDRDQQATERLTGNLVAEIHRPTRIWCVFGPIMHVAGRCC
jgi:hypothetical protein